VFQDAIASLSAEQQSFAEAFRSMQLAGTLFAVCVIQIKPALEQVLRLPNNALSKQIRMKQDVELLFIKCQLSADLLRCEENDQDKVSVGCWLLFCFVNTNNKQKVESVKRNVNAMLDLMGGQALEQLRQVTKPLPSLSILMQVPCFLFFFSFFLVFFFF
jgi:hypothetical protein